MTSDIKFSVCITTYKRWHLCQKALSSVLNQTYDTHQIILIDDDPSSIIPENIQNLMNSGKVTYFRNEHNYGLARSRNKGLNLSTGEYFVFCDDDDYWHLDYLETLRVDLAKFDLPEVLIMLDPIYRKNTGQNTDIKQLIWAGFTPPVAAQCYKLRNRNTNNVNYSVNCSSGVDHDLWLNLLKANPRTAITFATKIGQQDHDGTQITTNYETRISKIEETIKMWDTKFSLSVEEKCLYDRLVLGYMLYLERNFAYQILVDNIMNRKTLFLGRPLSGLRGLRNIVIRKIIRLLFKYRYTTLDSRI
jgi:glycosyltransferase involved in cell wall biosynthesis